MYNRTIFIYARVTIYIATIIYIYICIHIKNENKLIFFLGENIKKERNIVAELGINPKMSNQDGFDFKNINTETKIVQI